MKHLLISLLYLALMNTAFSIERSIEQPFYELSICAIFKDEAPYLKEWIEFHELQGVDHFFLYNNNSSDGYLEILTPYIDSGKATLINWCNTYPAAEKKGVRTPWLNIQSGSYRDCIKRYGESTTWLAFIDLDEFLFCPSGQSIKNFLSDYREYGGLCVNWLLFGTSFLEDIPSNSLMIESLVKCAPSSEKRNHGMKSIVRPSCVVDCQNAHSFVYKKGFFAVTVDGKKTTSDQEYSERISHDQIRINHYWTRSESHFRNKKMASRQNRRAFDDEKALRTLSKCYNECTDDSILQFVPELKKRMQYEN